MEKVHCVWLSDGEMKVLLETKALPSPDNLRAVPVITMEPTPTLQTSLGKK